MRANIQTATIQLYHLADTLCGGLIILIAVLSPWLFGCTTSLPALSTISLFGCTKPWTITVINLGCYLLGLLFVLKRGVLLGTGYMPPRQEVVVKNSGQRSISWFMLCGAAVGTALVVGFELISVLNARSNYEPELFAFKYHSYLRMLPHSFDRASSWDLFLNHVGLAFFFWSVWDWLQGGALQRRRATNKEGTTSDQNILPPRLERFLWILTLNGVLLGLVGVLQRQSGTDKILWLMKPFIVANPFGPFSYHANAAQYFNLVWPMSLGLWWILQHRQTGDGRQFFGRKSIGYHHWLIPCVVIMAACPILSGSRGGAIITFMGVLMVALVLFLSLGRTQGGVKLGLFLFLLCIFGVGFFFGGEQLVKRMSDVSAGYAGREAMYEVARPMAQDAPIFGLGPGTFGVLFQFYRPSLETYWHVALHNDWLETLITFGWVGSGLIALTFFCVVVRWFTPGGIPSPWPFVSFFWVALVGCLVHARFDFPFQVHSILLLYLTLCAILLSLSRAGDRGSG